MDTMDVLQMTVLNCYLVGHTMLITFILWRVSHDWRMSYKSGRHMQVCREAKKPI